MKDITVPKPPRRAFNPDRPASDLLRQQVRHLEWAVRHAGERRAEFDKIKDVTTEREAADRTRRLLPRLPSAAQLSFSVIPIPEDEPYTTEKKKKKKATGARTQRSNRSRKATGSPKTRKAKVRKRKAAKKPASGKNRRRARR